MKRVVPPTESQPFNGRSMKGSTLASCPLLLEHLVADTYEDGSARERSALSLFVDGSTMKVALNDRDSRCSLYVAGDTLEACLKLVEGVLERGGGDWRSWSKGGKKK